MPEARSHDSAFDRAMLPDVLKGDFRAIARLITAVENESAQADAWLRELFPHTGHAFTLGVTGAPGSGKSTLVDRLTAEYRRRGDKVAVIAVDPSSPFSGGAILGDRIRMQSHSLDPGTFIRSMATRGNLGGLARTTADVVTVLDAAGFDLVIIETVGVGQDEVDVARTAEATLVLLVPGMGDDIQAMKAGIMEIADVFVINKSDHPGADRVEVELSALLTLSNRADGWKPAVVRTVATTGEGVAACIDAVEAFRKFQESSPARQARRIQVQKERLLELVRSRVARQLLGRPQGAELLERLAERVAARELDPYTAADELLALGRDGPGE
jgi:LAO/AO transport system kinase